MPRFERFLLIPLLLAASSPFAAAGESPPVMAEDRQPDLPDSPAGRRLREWLTAFNSGRREALAQFHTESVTRAKTPPEQRTAMHSQAAQFSGGLKITAVRSGSPLEIDADAETRISGDRVRVHLAVDEAEPHGVVDFALRIEPGGSAPSSGRLNDAEIARQLEAHMGRLVAADAFSGVVIVAKGGKPFFARAYGMADRDANVPNRLDTRFSLASMGKMFTAVAVLRLAAEGKLSLDDTVGKHLPDYPNRQVAEKVTIRQLLTHASGMGDFFGEKWNARRAEIRTLADHITLFADEPLAFEPGAKWRYSNAGYVVLGAILEKVAGRGYEQIIAAEIFAPAGMRDSGFFSPENEAANRAVGYTLMGLDGKPLSGTSPQPIRHGRGGPAGGAWSTAEDLLRFAETLRTPALLDAETTALATGPRVETGQGPGAAYGYGFEIQAVNGKRVYGHYGGFPGVSAGLEVYPDLGYTVVILSNSDMGGQRVIGRLHDWIARD